MYSDYEVSYNDGFGTVTIDFNICAYTTRTCSDSVDDYANEVNENNTCSHMSSTSISDVAVSLIDSDTPDTGIYLEYSGTVLCNTTAYYSLTIQLECDEDATTATYALDTSSLTYPCSPIVVMSTDAACPVVSLNALYYFF